MKSPKQACALVLVLATSSLIAAACNSRPGSSMEPPGAEANALTRVSTVVAATESVTVKVQLPADLRPSRRATLAAEIPGTVQSMTFEESSWVREGQELLSIDTRALEQGIAEAEALNLQAQTAYASAERLFEKRAITNGQLLEATTNRDVVQARLASARLQLERSKPVAPWSGRVSRRLVEVGDYVVPGQPIAVLLDVAVLEVSAPASASDAPHLEVGTAITIEVDGSSNRKFEARITRLGAELDPATRTLAVTARLPNRNGELRPGMTARMTVPRRALEDVLLVPLDALVELGDASAVYVVVARGAETFVERRVLELGAIVDRRVVVTSGLMSGDRVVVEGRLQVADGQAVIEVASDGVGSS